MPKLTMWKDEELEDLFWGGTDSPWERIEEEFIEKTRYRRVLLNDSSEIF